MIRLLFFIALAFGIYYIWSTIRKLKQQTTSKPADTTEPMVKCAYCEVYTPQKASVHGSNGQWYCCSEHERQARN